MHLNEAIQHLKESIADPTQKWGCEECKAEHEQLLEWLDDYKQLDEKPPERIAYLVTDGYCAYLGYYSVSEKHWITEEDTDGNSLLYWMPIHKPPKE